MREWFRHDFNAHEDRKMVSLFLKKGYEGIGVFWTAIEIIGGTEERSWRKKEIPELAHLMRIEEPKLREFIQVFLSLDLFKEDKQWLWSNGLKRRMADWDEKSEQAKMAVQKRWENYRNSHKNGHSDTSVLRPNNERNTIRREERR